MLSQESITHQNIEWIFIVAFDDKHRFTMPTDWRNNFSVNEELVLMYTGNFALLVKKSIFKQHIEAWIIDPELIINTTKIDKIGRVIIPHNFIKAFNIATEENIALFWKDNHIELYFEKDKYSIRKSRALQAAVKFQVELLTRKHS